MCEITAAAAAEAEVLVSNCGQSDFILTCFGAGQLNKKSAELLIFNWDKLYENDH